MGDVAVFFSNDPREGEKAVGELSQQGVRGLEAVLPSRGPAAGHPSRQVNVRLLRLVRRIGPDAIPIMLDRIENGDWFTKVLAAPAFAAFEGSEEAEAGLAALARSSEIDVQRLALEGLGYVSTSGYAGFAQEIASGRVQGSGGSGVDRYVFGKLGHYGTLAVLRMFAKGGSRGQLAIVEEMVEAADKYLTSGQSFDFGVEEVLREVRNPVAADPLVQEWLSHGSERYRRFALVALASLRLRRTVETVASVIGHDKSPSIDVAAGIALGEIVDTPAAETVARLLRDGATSEGIHWAFSILYAIEADWPDAVPIASCLARDGDVRAQMLLTLALRKDARQRDDTIRGLYDSRPWVRATSALTLARLLGTRAEPYLSHMAEEESSEVERTHALAALVHAGRLDVGEQLHAELRRFVQFPGLRRCWQRELLSAVQLANGPADAEIWAEIAGEPLTRVNSDLALLTGEAAAAERPPATPAVVRADRDVDQHAPDVPRPPRIFISYSHQDKLWLERFLLMLKPAIRTGQTDVWSDQRLQAGDLWLKEIEEAIDLASVAVFLVSADFLASDFIQREEIPRLMTAAEQHGLRVIWVALSHSLYELSPLSRYQCANDPSHPLSELATAKREKALVDIARKILDAARSSATPSPAGRTAS